MKLEPAAPPARLRITLPAGKYVIGDPSYVIPAHLWMNFVELGDYKNPDPDHIVAAKFDGKTAIGIATAYGDGVYDDLYGNSYGVDSGMIGAVPKSLFGVPYPQLVHEHMFNEPFDCYFRKGKIVIGNVIIDTN